MEKASMWSKWYLLLPCVQLGLQLALKYTYTTTALTTKTDVLLPDKIRKSTINSNILCRLHVRC
jgi:hypothetical protein